MSDIARGDESSPTEPEVLGQRLREARESLGLPQSTVADHLDIPRTAVSEIEAGRRKVTFLELKRLAALYRRPIAYFSGDTPGAEDETTTALYRTTEELSSTDREQVLRFAQFLRDAGPAVPPTRARSSRA
ncbi:MAG: helix-turn-helix transcriptional regulator [Ilumatobacter fluminis]|uniref:helix-turn-helix domain-containing protein n=1 Tax=Ilumatobacter fluminis TaxID=467091 RepID=UPI0032EF382E